MFTQNKRTSTTGQKTICKLAWWWWSIVLAAFKLTNSIPFIIVIIQSTQVFEAFIQLTLELSLSLLLSGQRIILFFLADSPIATPTNQWPRTCRIFAHSNNVSQTRKSLKEQPISTRSSSWQLDEEDILDTISGLANNNVELARKRGCPRSGRSTNQLTHTHKTNQIRKEENNSKTICPFFRAALFGLVWFEQQTQTIIISIVVNISTVNIWEWWK